MLSLGREAPQQSKGLPECLQKVREAERALQRSLHLAREAVITLNEPEPEKHEEKRGFLAEGGQPPWRGESGGVSHQSFNTDKTTQTPGTTGTASSLPDRAKCQSLFDSVDQNGSGTVNIIETRKLMDELRETPMTDAEFDDLKLRVITNDKDSDGQLSFEEFYKLVCSQATSKKDPKQRVIQLQKEAAKASQQEHMSPEQIVQVRGVPQSAVTRYLRKELDETGACLQLPWAALIFLFYFLAVRSHFDLDRLHAVDQAISWDIHENANFAFTGISPFENGRMGHKNIGDVNSIADFWSFVNMGIVPLFWPSGWDVNEHRLNTVAFCQGAREALRSWGGHDTPTLDSLSSAWNAIPGDCPDKAQDDMIFSQDMRSFFGTQPGQKVGMDGTYLLFHRIVGGVRLLQERVSLEECPDRGLKNYIGMCASRPAFWLSPEIQRSLKNDDTLVNNPGGETVHLLNWRTQDQIRNQLRELENRAWFGPQTRKIQLLFTTYNMNEDMLTATYILFFLNQGGHIFKNVEPVSIFLDAYHSGWPSYFFDFLWCGLCLKLVLEESFEIFKHWRQLGFFKGTRVYMCFANAIDWVSIVFTIFLIIFWMLHLDRLDAIKTQLSKADLYLPGTWQTMAERDAFYRNVDLAVQDTHNLRTGMALYPFVIVGRFFKAFSSQPRLAMVTKTFAKAAVDIFHFGVVFFLVFTIFAFAALILWGQELEEFANEGRAFHSTFRVLLGDFDWEPLTSVGRMYAYIWFWAYVWLVNLIMLNMLLAIIMDVYTDVKSSNCDAETLWSQSVEIFHRARDVWQGKMVSLGKVLQALDPTDLDDGDDAGEEVEDEVLFPSSFASKVPKMDEDQAFHILLEALKLKLFNERDNDSMSEALVRIQDIDDRTKTIQEHLVRLIAVQRLPNARST